MKQLTSLTAAVVTAAFLAAATSASAQDANTNQRTYLTFSGPVQMPGVTLPAGKYLFRLADTSLHNVMQVLDGDEKDVIGQWFFIPKNRTTEEASAANGKPVVVFMEVPEGTIPAVQFYFYPTDLTGKEFIYPKDQALKLAAISHRPVLATDTDVASGGEAHVFTVEPSSTASAEPAPVLTSRPTDLSGGDRAATGTSGAYDQNPAPLQQASNELPKTASPFQMIGLIGLIALAGGCALRFSSGTI